MGGLNVNPENFQIKKLYAVMFVGKSLSGTYTKHTKASKQDFQQRIATSICITVLSGWRSRNHDLVGAGVGRI